MKFIVKKIRENEHNLKNPSRKSNIIKQGKLLN